MPQTAHWSESGEWSRVKSIFDGALSLSPGNRSEWIDRVCDNAALAGKVKQLLYDFESAGSFLEKPFSELLPAYSFEEGSILNERFRVLKLIGLGGMGEVYEAEDLVSSKKVALKAVLHQVAADADRTARFRKELQLTQQVSHPNVCRVFELWQTPDGPGRPVMFFTMELLEGETLAERLRSGGPLKPSEALPIIRQVASGLSEVHRLGIVHRDLKPSNIFLSRRCGTDDAGNAAAPAGPERAVVMDFGIARTLEAAPADAFTRTGALLGTPAYMSPEQLSGGRVTQAGDIYAFGVLIFEMITGRSYPLLSPRKLVPGLGSSWETAIHQCLDIDPARRPREAVDVVKVIEAGERKKVLRAAVAIGLLCAVIALLGFAAWFSTRSQPVIGLSGLTQLTFDHGFTTDVSGSSDGKLAVYVSDRGMREGQAIWMQSLETDQTRQLTHDTGREAGRKASPVISPDDQEVAYRSESDDMIYTMPVAGGTPRAIARGGRNPRYSPDGSRILFWTGSDDDESAPSGRVFTVARTGGAPEPVAASFADARFPAWSPDGNQILFSGTRDDYSSANHPIDWWIVDRKGGAPIATGALAAFHRYALDVHHCPVSWDRDRIVFSAREAQSTNLWTISLSHYTHRVSGDPRRVTTGSGFEVSPWVLHDGRILFSAWNSSVNLYRIATHSSHISAITSEDWEDVTPSVSSDGRMLTFGRRFGALTNIMSKNLITGSSVESVVTQGGSPKVSPDGSQVAYAASHPLYWGHKSVLRLRTLPNGPDVQVCEDCGQLLGWNWQGTHLLVLRAGSFGRNVVELLELATGLRTPVVEGQGLRDCQLSPDGRRIAFTIQEPRAGSLIYAAAIDETGPVTPDRWVLITPLDTWSESPRWTPDSHEIVYGSNRDRFFCFWRQQVTEGVLQTSGPARAIWHFHTASFSPGLRPDSGFALAIQGDRIVFNSCSMRGNVWSLRP